MSMQITTYIMLDGTAKEAIAFYQKALGAKLLFMQTAGEGPQNPDKPMSEAEKEPVAHAVLKVDGGELMVADSLPDQPPQQGNQVSVCLTLDEAAQAREIFEALKENGHVEIPLGEMYFSPAFGLVVDKFGVTFQIFTKRAR
ncbi:VOC family protein [Paenibacillus sp. HWE-109]|uniref:VOC family protein n=1 Tax=Paenibacillus sp. HWE-109 TaxID=1306526 RepID=UPI001EE0E09F|nr:VOC family protein [Paenibacillus sp. HWE-109]UKS27146.1 VOC family protein [Paenibacillus sp. HWE-109]